MSNDKVDTPEYEGWAIVELLGHRRRAGEIRECTIAGKPMLAITIPRKGKDPITQYYSGEAVYGITPCTEETATAVAHSLHWAPPVHVYDLLNDRSAVEEADVVDDQGGRRGKRDPV
ncbi:MAG: acetyltransferase [Proteobacteria bacterium]|nr:acetyltransferase [Pseudomonadota bacterium]